MRWRIVLRGAAVVLCLAIVAAVVRPPSANAEEVVEPEPVVEPQPPQPVNPACTNLLIQATNASLPLLIQIRRMFQVCSQQGWDSGACLAQIGVVTSALYWAWWTWSTYYCNCPQPKQDAYCAAIGILPAPVNPGGGGGALPPPGPQPPRPPGGAGGAL